MKSNAKGKQLLAACVSLALLIFTLQLLHAQDGAITDAGIAQNRSNTEVDEAVSAQNLQLVAEQETVNSSFHVMNEVEERQSVTNALSQQLFMPIIQGGVDDQAEVVAAFQQGWSSTCTNVLASERGLWDDMPIANFVSGDNNKAGLLWFVPTEPVDEKCSYSAGVSNILTSNFPTLTVRVAVNDGALFKVELYEKTNNALCTLSPFSLTTGAADDNSQFRTLSLPLPANRRICRVKITLDDDADTIASGRASALIDYIRIWGDNLGGNVNTRAIGWGESFMVKSRECISNLSPDQLAAPADKPYWKFILNFDEWQGNQPIACILLYHIGEQQPFDAISFPCTLTPGAEKVGSTVRLTGGHVRCPINLYEVINARNDPFFRLLARHDYPNFSIAGSGILSTTAPTTNPYANPVVVYQPSDDSKLRVGLFTPWLSLSYIRIVSAYRSQLDENQTKACRFQINILPPEQQWYMTLIPGVLNTGTLNNWLNSRLVQPCQPLENAHEVQFWTTDGIFFAGGQENGPSFLGTLDEVIVDPTGSTQPSSN